jgi:hypothetical protein
MVKPKAQGKYDADQETGAEREVKGCTAAVVDDVSGQMAEVKPAREEDQTADDHNHPAEHDQELSQLNHILIVDGDA